MSGVGKFLNSGGGRVQGPGGKAYQLHLEEKIGCVELKSLGSRITQTEKSYRGKGKRYFETKEEVRSEDWIS